MDCTLIEGDLVPFHFGTLDDGPRAAVEQHLVSCARCLQAFLEVKRAIEKGDAAPRPSASLRARLRAQVAEEFAPRRPWRVWGAVAAMLVAATTLVGLYAGRPAPAPAPLTVERPVDTARPPTAIASFM